jgi:dTDP-glucose pyrophosphorylase
VPRPSPRGERKITPANNIYPNQGLPLYEICHAWWRDTGTFASLPRQQPRGA